MDILEILSESNEVPEQWLEEAFITREKRTWSPLTFFMDYLPK